MNKNQTVDKFMRMEYGLHPYERLCEKCPLHDCLPHREGCLQRQVIGKDPVGNTHSWRKMTVAMIEAGMRDELADIPIVLGLEEDRRKREVEVVNDRRKPSRMHSVKSLVLQYEKDGDMTGLRMKERAAQQMHYNLFGRGWDIVRF